MAILHTLEVRRAYRALKTDPIASEVLLRLVEAAHLVTSTVRPSHLTGANPTSGRNELCQ